MFFFNRNIYKPCISYVLHNINKQKKLDYNRKWKKKNPNYMKKYVKENIDKIRGYKRDWARQNKEKSKEEK